MSAKFFSSIFEELWNCFFSLMFLSNYKSSDHLCSSNNMICTDFGLNQNKLDFTNSKQTLENFRKIYWRVPLEFMVYLSIIFRKCLCMWYKDQNEADKKKITSVILLCCRKEATEWPCLYFVSPSKSFKYFRIQNNLSLVTVVSMLLHAFSQSLCLSGL